MFCKPLASARYTHAVLEATKDAGTTQPVSVLSLVAELGPVWELLCGVFSCYVPVTNECQRLHEKAPDTVVHH